MLLAYLFEEKLGQVARSLLTEEGRRLFLPHTAVMETYYVTCRRRGSDYADRLVGSFLDGMYTEIVSSVELDLAAARYKCERSISLADCYVIAAAKLNSASALFLRQEEDLEKGVRSRGGFDVDVRFLTESSLRADRS